MKKLSMELYEDYFDLFRRLDCIASTVDTIHHAMEQEQVSPHILHTYVTIYEAICGVLRDGTGKTLKLARLISEEEKKHG